MSGAENRGPRLGTFKGEPAVFMGLQDGTEAVTTPAGYAAVEAAGCVGAWFLNSRGGIGPLYVRCKGLSAGGVPNLRSVAALVSGTDRDHQTTYINGNRRDLRPQNLRLEDRRGRRAPLGGPGWDEFEGPVRTIQ